MLLIVLQVDQRCQIWVQCGSDWTQMGQIRNFFRLHSVHFCSPSQDVLNSDLKKSRICQIWDQSDPLWNFGPKSGHPELY